MLNQPVFSIIVCSYNEPLDRIGKTLSSIRSQTFSSYELIYVDGKSTISPLPYLESFNFDSFKYSSSADSGVYEAMNNGIALASGIWVIFINIGDTLYDKHTLYSLHQYLPGFNSNHTIFYGDYSMCSETFYSPKHISLRHLYSSGICHQSIVASLALLQLSSFDLSFKLLSDRAWLIKSLKSGVSFNYIPLIVSSVDDWGLSSNVSLKLRETYCLRLKYYSLLENLLFFPSVVLRYFRSLCLIF